MKRLGPEQGSVPVHADDEAAARTAQWRHRLMFSEAPVGIGLADEKGHFVSVNAALCRLFGRTEDELIGHSGSEFTHPDDLGQHRRAEHAIAAAEAGVLHIDKQYVRPDGSVRSARLSIRHVDGPAGEQWTLAHMTDTTEEHRAAAHPMSGRAGLRVIARVMRSIQRGEDARDTIVAALTELSGAPFSYLVEPHDDAYRVTAATDRRAVGTRIGQVSASASAFRTGQPAFVPDPAAHPLISRQALDDGPSQALLFTPIPSRDDIIGVLIARWPQDVDAPADAAVEAVSLLADQAGVALTNAALFAELEHLATTDALTGLPNRRGWSGASERLAAGSARDDQPLTVALVDIDFFKRYNDERGHAAGDELLTQFAAAARTALRGVDLIARWGGEEFAVALPDCAPAAAIRVLDRVRSAMPDRQTCSIGYTAWRPGESVDAALSRADQALYVAKVSGRDRAHAL